MLRSSTDEGAQDHYFIKIHTKPSSGTTVTLTSAVTGETQVDFAASPTSLVFNENNWNVRQRVNITAATNKIDNVKDLENLLITYTATSTDPVYTSLIDAPDTSKLVVLVDVLDVETAGYLLDSTAATISGVVLGKDANDDDLITRTDNDAVTTLPIMLAKINAFATTPETNVELITTVCSNNAVSTHLTIGTFTKDVLKSNGFINDPSVSYDLLPQAETLKFKHG
jgi:hypothetical protein